MKIYAVSIENFRGIRSAKLVLPDHAVLIGDNNTGKSSVLEAIDLALGPDRLSRRSPVDEHDFFEGKYLPVAAAAQEGAVPDEAEEANLAEAPKITVEVIIIGLSEEQEARFGGNIEWLNVETGVFFTEANPAGVDAANIKAALRVTFIGAYDSDEDDFVGNTFYSRSLTEADKPEPFSKKDKQHCGFLFLRSLRTGSRALSLEHGSLLDIILRLKEIRPQMWEGTIGTLAAFDVASDPAIGISGVLDSIDKSLKKYVPREWGVKPHLKVSNLTREHLRKVVTAFIATGDGDHAAPFYRQGTGTINMLVLAMLSQIAEDTYHSFFWRILKAHGYLVGFPRRMTILTPPNEAIALSAVRSGFKPSSKLSDEEKAQKAALEAAERMRLATDEGKVCFDLFAERVAILLHGSAKVRELVSTMYPFIVLDEFQDTSAEQWRAVDAIGKSSTLIALADPEQRIFDFIGADPERLNHFKEAFKPSEHDLAGDNHRSKGTDIAIFGNHLLSGKFRDEPYQGVEYEGFASNPNQAYASLVTQVLRARQRVIALGRRDWSLAILVPTKRMTRLVSDNLRAPFGNVPPITHTAAVDMEGPILAAEVIAFLLQKRSHGGCFDEFIDVLCSFFDGRGGAAPTKGHLADAARFRSALEKWNGCLAKGKAPPGNSILQATFAVHQAAMLIALTGQPDADWTAVREVLEAGACTRLAEVAQEARNVRLLERVH